MGLLPKGHLSGRVRLWYRLRVGEEIELRQSPRPSLPGQQEIKSREALRAYGHLAVCDGRKYRDFLVERYAPGGLNTVFQPIFFLGPAGHELYGFECLTRGPVGTALESADSLFQFARTAGTVCSLDRACIARGLQHAADFCTGTLLFLNLHPETLKHDIDFPRFLESAAKNYGIALDRIVIELLEYSRIAWVRPSRRCRALGGLRDLGVRLALDDVHTSLDDVTRVAEYEPDFIKIDGDVLRGARYESSHRRFMVMMLDFADRTRIEVIAEGLESEQDLRLIEAAEITMAQGYYLGRPAPAAELKIWPIAAGRGKAERLRG